MKPKVALLPSNIIHFREHGVGSYKLNSLFYFLEFRLRFLLGFVFLPSHENNLYLIPVMFYCAQYYSLARVQLFYTKHD